MTQPPVPDFIEGYGPVKHFTGAFAHIGLATRAAVKVCSARPGIGKVLPSIRAAIRACGLRDGATISFHHHLRNGDDVLRAVMAEIASLGLRDIRVAASSVFPVHAPLAGHIESGVVTGLATAYLSGPVAEAVARGFLQRPLVMQTHGGRARAIEAGDIHIDVAFVAAPTADIYGNLNGVGGKSACGTLGYPMVDVKYADRVVAITDCLVPYPACPIDITQDDVDFVVEVPSIGDPRQIVSGTTRVTDKPEGLKIAATAADVVEASGLLVDGFSFQTGAGGVSLAVAACLRERMAAKRITGSFAAGGITGTLVEMFEAGLFRSLFNVQCFDLKAVESYRRDAAHQAMSASMYANPHNRGAVVNLLDVMILGAAEVDLDFNVNVTLGSSGVIIGGSGGHSDTAAGAKLALVTTQLAARHHPKIVDCVASVTTPGETIDAVVTEEGVAVNPRRADLRDRLASAGLPLCTIEELRSKSQRRAGGDPSPPRAGGGRIVAVVEYRDGTVIDVVRASA
ncbi:citrate lyase subunit alpha [Enterovirga sp.]|uniref:citrate lyase subunit alpha n=1 Tax=Enterovirga sp. TaxID=2026350 RepID=UPI002BBF765D|nr:citrate lyase subunit alpha [Enterovirga sp.]HMO29025.1 citrate lyase subunit alpha [Enterovirga sp.]